MHARNIVHMDVKPDNIYVVNDTTYKLGDLGLATSSCSSSLASFEEGDARYCQLMFRDLDVWWLMLVFPQVAVPLGSLCCVLCRYIPSEILKGNAVDLKKADMFMLGITLYELATNRDLPTGEH